MQGVPGHTQYLVFATGGNWGSESDFLQQTGEFSESGEVPQIPLKFWQAS